MSQFNTFGDLADGVSRSLANKGLDVPSASTLHELFGTLFYTSLKTEEGQSITCHIVWIDPAYPDPNPPMRITSDRWNYVPLADPIQFSIPNLTKIAKATDSRTSSLAVFPNSDNVLMISGFIDQGNQYHEFVNHDSSSGAMRPGLFQTSILGLGHVVSYVNYDKVAELNAGALVTRSYDVLWSGPIHDILLPSIEGLAHDVKSAVGTEKFDVRDHWLISISSYWIASLCRILLRIQNYRHGGSLLITPDLLLSGLDIKYGLNYPRLYNSLRALSIAAIEKTFASDAIQEKCFPDESFEDELYGEQDNNLDSEIIPSTQDDDSYEEYFDVPAGLYLDETVFSDEYRDCESQLNGVVWFISLLSRVDGVILLDPNLNVKGFGTMIDVPGEITNVFTATDESGSDENLHPLHYSHFGTRHRSMMRYCNSMPGSIGFVISQDGDVRVITKIGERLIIWENVKLKRDDFEND